MRGDLSDGCGDSLSESEMVSNFSRWAHTVANSRRPAHDPLHDDLVQEALTEIWMVLRRKGTDVSATYLALAGKHRMDDVLSGRPMRGNPTEGGQTYRPRTVSAEVVAEASPSLWEELTGVDALSEVEMAYHQGEIVQALSVLKPQYRRYVVLRFWGGMRDVDIAREMGLSSHKVVNTWWTRTIRPALRAELAHLGAP